MGLNTLNAVVILATLIISAKLWKPLKPHFTDIKVISVNQEEHFTRGEEMVTASIKIN